MYKVLADDTIVGVIDVPSYIRYQNRNGMFLACDKLYAQGVVSQNGKTIWQLKDAPVIPVAGYTTVELIAIEEEEYNTLKELFDKADEEETDEITNLNVVEKATLEVVINAKIKEMSEACSNTIVSGFNIELSDGNTYHFALTLEDQVNMIELRNRYNAGETQIPYHSSGELCRYYSAEDIALILEKSDNFKNYNVVYFNSLRNYIKSLTDISKVSAITYGVEIPKKYQSEVLKNFA